MSSENLQFWNNTPEKVELHSCFSGVSLLKIGSAAPVLQVLFLYSIGFARSHFLQMFYRSTGIFCACSRWNIHATLLQTRGFSTLYIVHHCRPLKNARRGATLGAHPPRTRRGSVVGIHGWLSPRVSPGEKLTPPRWLKVRRGRAARQHVSSGSMPDETHPCSRRMARLYASLLGGSTFFSPRQGRGVDHARRLTTERRRMAVWISANACQPKPPTAPGGARRLRRGKADWTNREACLPRRGEGARGAPESTTLVTTHHCTPPCR